jgi:WD40 repeat protein
MLRPSALVILLMSLSWGYCGGAVSSSGEWPGSLFEPHKTEGAPGPIATQIASFSNGQEVALLQFSPDGQYLAVSPTQQVTLHLWTWRREPHIVRTLSYPPPATLLSSRDGLKFSPDVKLLAFGNPSGALIVEIYDVATGAVVHQITEPARGGANSNVAFTPDGKYLLRTFDSANPGLRGGQIEMLRTDTWEGIWHLDVLPLFPYTLCISKDGKYAAVGGETLGRGVERKGRILIIDLSTHQIIRTLDDMFPPKAAVKIVSWHPDSVHLAAGTIGSSEDGLLPPPEPVKIIDTKVGRVVVSESAPATDIVGLQYSSDGRYLVESGDDWPSVRVWDADHRTLLQEIPVHAHASFAVAISSDSHYLAVSDRDRVTVWQLH